MYTMKISEHKCTSAHMEGKSSLSRLHFESVKIGGGDLEMLQKWCPSTDTYFQHISFVWSPRTVTQIGHTHCTERITFYAKA